MIELASLIGRHARYRGDLAAVVFEDQRLDWRAFAARVARLGNALRARGIGRGDRVATLAGNSLELLEAYWAVPTVGAVLVPLSPLLQPAGVASLLEGAQARCLITHAALLPALAPIRAALPPVLLVVGAGAGEATDYHAATAAQPATIEAEAVDGDAVFNLMYTSGTTGAPKGIVHSHQVRAMYGALMGATFRMTPESRVLHTGAIVFNGAFVMLMPAFLHGATYVLHRQFDPARVVDAIEAHRITHLTMVPAQIVALLGSPAFDPARLASLECVLSLGAPLLQPDQARLDAALPRRRHELYGLTEGFITVLDRDDAPRKPGSVGVPPPLSRIRVLRDDGSEAAVGEIGEIVGTGPFVMGGYHGRPDLSAQTLREGWIHSGDLGYLDQEGFLYLVDRRKDMIDSGGVKVYPRDIEEVAARHPAVREVAVFGVPHEKWGETPVAAVILHAGASISAEALRDWINRHVAARYQRVDRVLLLDDFPRSAAGKTLKRELREPFWAATGRRI